MAVQPYIRWMIKADMHQVLDIEQLCFSHPWNDADFLKVMRTRNNIGMVAVNHHDRVLGYMIYELHMRFIRLPNIAVHPLFYRHGIGSAMVEKLRGKLSVNRRTRLATEARETNLRAQLFFKSQGFRAVSVLKNFYDDSAEDAYMMQYDICQPEAATAVHPGQRLTSVRFER